MKGGGAGQKSLTSNMAAEQVKQGQWRKEGVRKRGRERERRKGKKEGENEERRGRESGRQGGEGG